MAFRIDPSQVLRGMSEARLKTMYACEKYAQAAAAKLEASAKADASWTDRTALARQTVAGVSDWVGDSLRIGVAGNMNYSPYLEFCHEKRFAVLWPTINKMAVEIIQGMHNII
ncbi:MAG: hypothetical protein RR482_00145 [Clostridia bacterium]